MRTHFEVPGTAVVEVCLLSVYASFQICLTLESSGGVLTSGQHCSSAAAAYQVPATEYFLFERSEFLIATSKKKNLCVRSTNLGFSREKIVHVFD